MYWCTGSGRRETEGNDVEVNVHSEAGAVVMAVAGGGACLHILALVQPRVGLRRPRGKHLK